MKLHLVSGGAGFVGRNLVKRLISTTNDKLIVIDDFSAGTPKPQTWMPLPLHSANGNTEVFGDDQRVFFMHDDFRNFLRNIIADPNYPQTITGFDLKISDVFHFAAIVGGRAKIDGDPMVVALDLSIDAEFFYWICRYKPERVLYPSSSAAYPTNLQAESGAIALPESTISFEGELGQPDMTYGWSKLTGEYLAQIAAKYYGISVACVRPFSGYGEDQDLTYPIPAIAARAARKEDPFEVWGTGKQGRDFVHIDDCIDCILMAIENIKDGTAINIGQGILTSFLDIIGLMSKFANYSPEILPLLDKPVGVHSRYANMDFVNTTYGWKPKISIEEGMRRVYEAAVKKAQE